MSETTVVSELETILGAEAVVAWDANASLAKRLSSALRPGTPPFAIAYPATQTQLAEVMAWAHGQNRRVLVCGQGSKLAWGGLTTVDLVISTTRLNRLVEHAVGDLTVTVEAGLSLAALQQQLALADQFLAVDPAYPDQATLGGIVATGDTGALRQRYGSVRDMLIGISFVRHDGQLAHAGGRVVKNVAGYDLMKLMTGSYGTLGAIAQLTFRTYPQQEASRTMLFSGEAAAVEALLQAVRRSPLTPVALDVLTPALGGTQQLTLAARFQAITAGVEEQMQRLQSLGDAENLSGQALTGSADGEFWQQVTERLWTQADPAPVVAKVGLNPSRAVAWLNSLGRRAALGRVHSRGIGWLQLPPDVSAQEIARLRSQLQSYGGYLTLLNPPMALKQSIDIWGYSGDALPIMQALKAQFDPNQRLSPGRFVGGL